jgi:hypothetical protein
VKKVFFISLISVLLVCLQTKTQQETQEVVITIPQTKHMHVTFAEENGTVVEQAVFEVKKISPKSTWSKWRTFVARAAAIVVAATAVVLVQVISGTGAVFAAQMVVTVVAFHIIDRLVEEPL